MSARIVCQLFKCCSALLLLTMAASAQSTVASVHSSSRPTRPKAPSQGFSLDRPYLRGGGSFQPGLGYSPGIVFGGGVDHRFSRVLLLSDASVDTAHKFGIKNGMSFRAGAGVYAMRKEFGLGGGARCGKLKTSVYDKGSCRPFIGGVYNSHLFRFDAGYYFSGTDKVNRLQGVRTVTLVPLSKHMAFELEFGVYRFNESFGAKKYVGVSSNPGIRYVF